MNFFKSGSFLALIILAASSFALDNDYIYYNALFPNEAVISRSSFAELQPGDIITAVDNQDLPGMTRYTDASTTNTNLRNMLNNHAIGTWIKLSVKRPGEPKTTTKWVKKRGLISVQRYDYDWSTWQKFFVDDCCVIKEQYIFPISNSQLAHSAMRGILAYLRHEEPRDLIGLDLTNLTAAVHQLYGDSFDHYWHTSSLGERIDDSASFLEAVNTIQNNYIAVSKKYQPAPLQLLHNVIKNILLRLWYFEDNGPSYYPVIGQRINSSDLTDFTAALSNIYWGRLTHYWNTRSFKQKINIHNQESFNKALRFMVDNYIGSDEWIVSAIAETVHSLYPEFCMQFEIINFPFLSDFMIFRAATEGMFNQLASHSSYLSYNYLDNLRVDDQCGFIAKNKKVLTVTPGLPADQAGLYPGDIILDEYIKNKPGILLDKTYLYLKVQHSDRSIQEILFRRNSNLSGLLPGINKALYGYVQLPNFDIEPVIFRDALNKLEKEANLYDSYLHGLILDLRDNPGGVIKNLIEYLDMFLDKHKLQYHGEIATIFGKTTLMGAEINAKMVGNKIFATSGELFPELPLIVLVNSDSISCAEMFADTLQAHNRAIVIGNTSFGKGVGTQPSTIRNRVTTNMKFVVTILLYAPDGRSVQGRGVRPDVEVAESETEDFSIDTPCPESLLKNHLEGPAGQTPRPSQFDYCPTQSPKEDDDTLSVLRKEDFQLYTALLVLDRINQEKNKDS